MTAWSWRQDKGQGDSNEWCSSTDINAYKEHGARLFIDANEENICTSIQKLMIIW